MRHCQPASVAIERVYGIAGPVDSVWTAIALSQGNQCDQSSDRKSVDGGQYQIEWKQFLDNDVIKMYILDNDLKPVPLKVDEFKVIPLVGNDPTPFELEAVDADDDGKSAVYTLDDKGLRMGINLGVKIEIVAGDQTLTGKIDAHEPLDH